MKKILLTSVFGPFGVDDAFGRKENIMELFHNQVTKAQGLASLRFHHRSLGLYFLAENVETPVAVLDYPSRERFIRTLKKERYDAVGISFIAPNFVKAREMARLVREIQPHAEIILGGHGAAIEGVEDLIECDHVVKGEGIRWLRRYLGEDENRPFRHPALPSAEHKRIFGVPIPGVAGLLIPGVGCVNGCRFCATTHFFGKSYTPFFSTGDELFAHASRVSVELGSDEFFVMDENFLKDKARAMRLLELMQENNAPFKFAVFSSAEAIENFGVENMARLGIFFAWIGAESKREVYDKNQGRDLGALVRRLRDHGISVLVSGILFLEHHTPENIREDIDYIVGLQGDYTQFMMFTPLPVTALYQQYKAQGLIDFDLPFEEWHGQHLLNWRHPHFTREQASGLIREAFQTEFDHLSSSIYRMTETALRGYRTLSRLAAGSPGDSWLALRRDQLRARVRLFSLLLPVMRRFAHDALEHERVVQLTCEIRQEVGAPTIGERLYQAAIRLIAEVHAVRVKLFGDMPQPRARLTKFRWKTARSEGVGAARRAPSKRRRSVAFGVTQS